MGLPQADRDRIYQEEKARFEAQAKLKAEENAKFTKYGCINCLELVILIAMIVALMPKSQKTEKDSEIMAYIMAQNFIRRQLNSPSTADFPSLVMNAGEVRILKLNDGSYRVSAWVDAQNVFGAKLRKNWVCELKEASKDNWQTSGPCQILE